MPAIFHINVVRRQKKHTKVTFLPFHSDKSIKNDIFVTEKAIGEMLEWLKRHAWKACKRQKRFGGSNPPLSAGRRGDS